MKEQDTAAVVVVVVRPRRRTVPMLGKRYMGELRLTVFLSSICTLNNCLDYLSIYTIDINCCFNLVNATFWNLQYHQLRLDLITRLYNYTDDTRFAHARQILHRSPAHLLNRPFNFFALFPEFNTQQFSVMGVSLYHSSYHVSSSSGHKHALQQVQAKKCYKASFVLVYDY